MPRPQFDDNGCLVVQCHMMIEKMAEIDTNADKCDDKAEFKEFMSKMHKPKIAE